MNTVIPIKSIVKSPIYTVISDPVMTAMEVAYEHHDRYKVLGQGPLTTGPYTCGDWNIAPVLPTQLPSDVRAKINNLYASGVNITQVLVAHEIPKPEPQAVYYQTTKDPFTEFLGETFTAVALVLGAILVIATLGVLCGKDPVAIAIVDDGSGLGTYLEVARWDE